MSDDTPGTGDAEDAVDDRRNRDDPSAERVGSDDAMADWSDADDAVEERADAPSAAAVRETAREFERAGRPYARVTVVRREAPVSANVGDAAVVTPEGDLVGWIGGAACAQSVVVREATDAIERGEPVLLGLAPDPDDVDRPGVEAYPMTCHSGGTLELFVEPVLPGPELVVVGDSPIARAVARLGAEVVDPVTVVTAADAAPDSSDGGADGPDETGVPAAATDLQGVDETVAADGAEALGDAVAGARHVVVASMSEYDELGLEAGLRSDAEYVGLVASDRRRDEVAAAVADRLDVDADAVAAAVTTPAGLDINARSPEEIAVSVLAELVALRRDADDPIALEVGDASAVDPASVPPDDARKDESAVDSGSDGDAAVDPVCGMDVAVDETTPSVEHDGETYHFCGQGCAEAFADDPDRYRDAEVGADA